MEIGLSFERDELKLFRRRLPEWAGSIEVPYAEAGGSSTAQACCYLVYDVKENVIPN